MRDLKTTSLDRPAPWLPSFDVHEQDGELVLHVDLMGFDEGELALDGSDLLVQLEGEKSRLPLPFPPRSLRAVRRPGHKDLEVHVLSKEEGT